MLSLTGFRLFGSNRRSRMACTRAYALIIVFGPLAGEYGVSAALAQQTTSAQPTPPSASPPASEPVGVRPRSTEREKERRAMVERQIAARGVRDPDVLEAMRQVPRHWFVPEEIQHAAYRDNPVPIGEGQTISQPYIVAFMTEALELSENSKVLEVGTGSGYQAAVLAEITPHVYTIEIVEPLARRAIATFQERGYGTIKTKIGDGYAGWAAHAPFDAIIVTCAPEQVPPKLVEQLRMGGRICIPVGSQHEIQRLRLVTKTAEGELESSDLMPVRFVPMIRGSSAMPGRD